MNFKNILRESIEIDKIDNFKKLIDDSPISDDRKKIFHIYFNNILDQIKIRDNRLMSDLKLDLLNHLDGLDMEMSITLGESYRDMVSSIYKILKKYNLDVKEYNKL